MGGKRRCRSREGVELDTCHIKLDLGFIPLDIDDFQGLANIVNNITNANTKFRQLIPYNVENDCIKVTIEEHIKDKEFCLNIMVEYRM